MCLSRRYQVHEFAALAEVRAKALRHYDRLRLLKPSRTVAGYRVTPRAICIALSKSSHSSSWASH